ncbi:hypothetical protein [Candidatus Parabeggiatoa sp. HSG14]|uniref:hypothetical protein n=1 Tax=Candidatus Parabeggiatoa sp. HSG14 TaxID=3055593 RepID=UPI0025A83A0F|nr:hypothetical protein [Thiotrichales bacterium HSG14]
MSFNITIVSAANNWNLDRVGFSSNSRYFIIVESRTDKAGIASARMEIVNTKTNECVRGGCQTISGSKGDLKNEEDILNKLYGKTWRLRARLKLTPSRIGDRAKGPFFEEDCNTAYYLYNNQKIHVQMQQDVISLSYYHKKASLQIEVNIGDVTKILDSLENYRDYTQKYRLNHLLISPNKKRFALLVMVFYGDGKKGKKWLENYTIVHTATLY